MQIGIVGLGLIGGSLAKAVSQRTAHTVWGANRSAACLQKAAEEGVIAGVLDDERLGACDLVFISLYPQATVDYVRAHAAAFGKHTVVVDCCGVKEPVCGPCEALAEEYGFTFIGGHPMAGIERSGYDWSKPDLFDGASMILTPPEGTDTALIERVSGLCYAIGFGMIRLSTPSEHDRMIALTSQLAHVLSSAYVKSPAALQHIGFSAGSFKDMTRVARLNEDMWTELFFDNRDHLLDEIEGLIGRLGEYADALREGDRERMHTLLREGRERKETVG